jgi:hypothetical protein
MANGIVYITGHNDLAVQPPEPENSFGLEDAKIK